MTKVPVQDGVLIVTTKRSHPMTEMVLRKYYALPTWARPGLAPVLFVLAVVATIATGQMRYAYLMVPFAIGWQFWDKVASFVGKVRDRIDEKTGSPSAVAAVVFGVLATIVFVLSCVALIALAVLSVISH